MSEKHLQNLQSPLQERSQMNSAAIVSDADEKLRWMVLREMRRPNDAGPALDRIIKRYKLRSSVMHTILYRAPSDILVSVYISICNAYEAELERQEKAVATRREITRAKTGFGAALLRIADQMDRVADKIGGAQDGGLTGGGQP